MSGFDDLAPFRATYIQECLELLREMEEHLLGLDNPDTETLNAIFRCAHSIKGGAGAFGLKALARFTHAAEFLLDAMREGKVVPTQPIIDALLQSVDLMGQMVAAAREEKELPESFGLPLATLLEEFAAEANATPHATAKENTPQEPSKKSYCITFTPHANLLIHGNEPLLLLRELARLGKATLTPHLDTLPSFAELDPEQCHIRWTIQLESSVGESDIRDVFSFVEDECSLDITEIQAATSKITTPATNVETPTAPTQAIAAASSIRVDLDKLDRLVNLVGELVITQTMLQAQARYDTQQPSELIQGIAEFGMRTRELQEAVMSVRMQPVKSVFSRMPRLVRDLSNTLGKRVRLEMSGESTEVDKTVIEQLGDPLTHMIRNAVDHGVERPETRREAGKPEEGTIRLSAMHHGGRILIRLEDDGGGVNRPKALARAKERGLVPAEANLSDSEIDHLIFLPGFSTADQVTDVSGRGVGMDVVRRNIEALGGQIQLISNPGVGSSFTITLPLTLAILDGMIVRIGQERYIIPIAHILESLRPAPGSIRRLDSSSEVIDVRGQCIRLVPLGAIFASQGSETDAQKAMIVLVEPSDGQPIGLIVDEVIGQQQVVIKSLEANADPIQGISGATILGDGKVSLILEINELKNMTPITTMTEAA